MKKQHIVIVLGLLLAGISCKFGLVSMEEGAPQTQDVQGQEELLEDILDLPAEMQKALGEKIAVPPIIESFLCRPKILQHNGPVRSVAFSPDNSKVITGSRDHTAKIWDANTGQPLHTLQHNDSVVTVAFGSDTSKVVTVSGNTAKIWDANTGQPLHTLQHNDSVVAVVFGPDAKKVVTGSWDRTAKIWDANTGQPLHTLQHNDRVGAVGFSPDAKKVVTGSWDRTAKIWDANTGQPLHTLPHNDIVNSVAFSPDNNEVVTKYSYNRQKIWGANTGQLLHTLQHNYRVGAVAFSPDSKKMITESRGHTAKIWDLSCLEALEKLYAPQKYLLQAFAQILQVEMAVRRGTVPANKKGENKINADESQWAVFQSLPKNFREALRPYIIPPEGTVEEMQKAQPKELSEQEKRRRQQLEALERREIPTGSAGKEEEE